MPWRCPITAASNWIAARRRWNWRRRVADAVGDRTEVYVDGGVRTGGHRDGRWFGGKRLPDRAVVPVRPDGMAKVIAILREELTRTMGLVGANTVADLDRSLVKLRSTS